MHFRAFWVDFGKGLWYTLDRRQKAADGKEKAMKPIKRAVHFDFHTMPGIDNFGENFDAEVFAQQLADAHHYICRTF